MLSLSTLYEFENIASSYINRELKAEEKSGLESDKHLFLTSVDIIDQQVDEAGFFNDEKAIIRLKSSVLLAYAGDEQVHGLDSILTELFMEDARKEELFGLLLGIVVDPETQSSTFATDFSPTGSDVVERTNPLFEIKSKNNSSRSGADKALIIACVILSIALVFVSFVLLWTVGGCENTKLSSCLGERYNGKGSKSPDAKMPKYGMKDDDDGDNVTSASGIIGANPNFNAENVPPPGMTPHRGVYRHDCEVMSPLSQTTNFTETDTSRLPLGIRSIRKLARYTTPDEQKDANPYAMSQFSYT